MQLCSGLCRSFTHFQTHVTTLPWTHTSPIPTTSLQPKLLISSLPKAQLQSERHWHCSLQNKNLELLPFFLKLVNTAWSKLLQPLNKCSRANEISWTHKKTLAGPASFTPNSAEAEIFSVWLMLFALISLTIPHLHQAFFMMGNRSYLIYDQLLARNVTLFSCDSNLHIPSDFHMCFWISGPIYINVWLHFLNPTHAG